MRHTEYKENRIEVYFRGKKVFAVEDTEFGVEVYDYHNWKVVDVKCQWLGGAFEEAKPYVDALIDSLTDNPSNTFLDKERKEVFKKSQVLKQIRKEIWDD
jgi:hypothetical protein